MDLTLENQPRVAVVLNRVVPTRVISTGTSVRFEIHVDYPMFELSTSLIDSNHYVINHYNYVTNTNHYVKEIQIRKKPFEFKEVKNKLIDKTKNIECPITYEPIKYEDTYVTCSECKYNFSEGAILKHLNCADKNRKCPVCRSNWVEYCKYVNKDEK